MMTETQELLVDFVKNGSESAFRELVTRYFDLVYSTAVRLVDGDTHRAEDVAQIVFTDLARMAMKLSGNSMLGGWLHRHTCFVARTAMRGERRRQAREKQAVDMNALNDKGDTLLAQVAPILDEAINELGPDDRDAILLRFFERRNLRSIGEVLGITENVAQKRVARAVEELGMVLRRHGVTLPAAALAAGLGVGAVTAAPAGVALKVAGLVLGGAATNTGIGLTSAKVAVMAKLKAGIVGGLIVAGVVTIIFLQEQSRLKRSAENRPVDRQISQPQEEKSPSPDPGNGQVAFSALKDAQGAMPGPNSEPPPTGKIADTSLVEARPLSVNPSPQPRPQAVTGSVARFYAKSGSKVRIKGTSNIHEWQVEGSLLGGMLEVGPDFPLEARLPLTPGPVRAQVDSFIMVRSLKSVDKDGRPYSDKMDELIYESLRSDKYPRILYHSDELTLKGTTRHDDAAQYEFESRGMLAVAGVTNEITMPVFVLPLGGGKLKISGKLPIKMSKFRIEPPSPELAMGLIKTGDDVEVTFDWMVALRSGSTQHSQSNVANKTGWPDELIPAESIVFINTDLSQVLAVYADLAEARLDLDKTITTLPPVSIGFTNTKPITRSEAIRLLDKTLLEQAGIEVTHPESSRVSMRLRH